MKQMIPLLCLFSCVAISHAQSSDSKQQPAPAKTAAAKPAASAEADLELKERRAKARSLLVSLSTDARTFHDQTLRARSLARIADALKLPTRKVTGNFRKTSANRKPEQAAVSRSTCHPTSVVKCCGLRHVTIDRSAKSFSSKIEESETRKQAQAYIDGSLAKNSVNKKLTDQALEMVHKGELTQIQKAWVLTECAKILARTDREKALEIVEEAANEARRIDVSDPALPRALIAVANALKVIDASRVWDATFDAVKAANSAEGFTGEDGEIILKFDSKGHSSLNTQDVPEFDLEGIFRDLAEQDYDRAVELARGFQAEGPRAVATIAIARAILEPRKKK